MEEKKEKSKVDIFEGGGGVGVSLVGLYFLWKHRPADSLQDLIDRGISDPDFFLIKEPFFYGGCVLMIMWFFYGLKKLNILK